MNDGADTIAGMRDFLILFVHLIATVARLARPGGLRSVVAESALGLASTAASWMDWRGLPNGLNSDIV